ncbi:MAG: thiamine phosphate synthase [Acidobacteria bacterium]|nr:thiamine phosphate synthase [Acidobacteriota bacterium]
MHSLLLHRIYPITHRANIHGYNHVELARIFLGAGIRFFQVREKELPDREWYRQLIEIRELCDEFGAQFMVNDRVDLALASRADGVHLGQDDLEIQTARKILGNRAVIGYSTHNREQFVEAQQEAVNYLAIGPAFGTGTKIRHRPPLGVDLIRQIITNSRHPVVAIGGIDLERATLLWKAGVASVAVISDVVNNPNPGQRIREYVQAFEKCSPSGP